MCPCKLRSSSIWKISWQWCRWRWYMKRKNWIGCVKYFQLSYYILITHWFIKITRTDRFLSPLLKDQSSLYTINLPVSALLTNIFWKYIYVIVQSRKKYGKYFSSFFNFLGNIFPEALAETNIQRKLEKREKICHIFWVTGQ